MKEKEFTPREKSKQELSKSKIRSLNTRISIPAFLRNHPEILAITDAFLNLNDLLSTYWSESLDREEKLEKEVAELKEKLAQAEQDMNRSPSWS